MTKINKKNLNDKNKLKKIIQESLNKQSKTTPSWLNDNYEEEREKGRSKYSKQR